MKIKIKKPRVGVETRILEACVISTEFLRQYSHIHRPDLFDLPFGGWLATECVRFLKDFGEAPKQEIRKMLNGAVKGGRVREEDSGIIRDFLKTLDYTVKSTNVPYLISQTENFFNLRMYRRLKEHLEEALERDDVKLCEQSLVETKKVRTLTGQVVDLDDSKEKLIEAFEKNERPLFRLKGDLGKMLNSQLRRQRFIAFLSKAKAGKTWVLYKLALIAKMHGLKVAIFAAGDEDEDSSLLRISILLTRKNNDPEFCGETYAPVMDCLWNQNGTCRKKYRTGRTTISVLPEKEDKDDFLTPERIVSSAPSAYVPCTHCRKSLKHPDWFMPAVWYKKCTVEELGWREAWKAIKNTQRISKSRLKLYTYPSDTLTVSEMERVLDVEEDQTGWVPDIVVVDYPDLMKDEGGSKEFRHQENNKWKGLRRFNQERNNLVLTVTQTNRTGYKTKSIGAESVNEDRRKLDHVTAMYALNQTDQEKALHLLRIGPIVQRKGRFETSYQVCVLQAIEQGQPFRDSFFMRMKPSKEEDV